MVPLTNTKQGIRTIFRKKV